MKTQSIALGLGALLLASMIPTASAQPGVELLQDSQHDQGGGAFPDTVLANGLWWFVGVVIVDSGVHSDGLGITPLAFIGVTDILRGAWECGSGPTADNGDGGDYLNDSCGNALGLAETSFKGNGGSPLGGPDRTGDDDCVVDDFGGTLANPNDTSPEVHSLVAETSHFRITYKWTPFTVNFFGAAGGLMYTNAAASDPTTAPPTPAGIDHLFVTDKILISTNIVTQAEFDTDLSWIRTVETAAIAGVGDGLNSGDEDADTCDALAVASPGEVTPTSADLDGMFDYTDYTFGPRLL